MRTRKTIINISVSVLYQITAFICGLITPRLMLGAFGSAEYGVAASVTQFMGMVSLLTMGVAGPARAELYQALAKNDMYRISGLIKAANKLMKQTAVAAVVYTMILSLVFPVISHSEMSWSGQAALIVIISSGTMAQYFIGAAYTNLLAADQKEYILSMLSILSVLASTALSAVLIFLKSNIYMVRLGAACISFLSQLCIYWYAKKQYQLTWDCEADDTALRQRKDAIFHSLANIVHDNVDVMVLTFFMDIRMVSVYAVYNIVAKGLRAVKTALTSGLEAAFGSLWAGREYRLLKERFRILELGMDALTVILFTCTGLQIMPFITLYTRNIHDADYILPMYGILVTIAEALFFFREPYQIMVSCTGSFKETKKGAAAEAAVNLILSVILVPVFGIHGAVAGTIAANAVRTAGFMKYATVSLLKEGFRESIKKAAWSVLTAAAVILVCLYFRNDTAALSWKMWVMQSAAVFVTAAAVTGFSMWLFFREEAGSLLKLFQRLTGAKGEKK